MIKHQSGILSLNANFRIMKILSSTLLFLFLFTLGFSQKNDIEVFEKKEGNKNLVFARNTGKVSYLVTLTINAKGMEVTPSMKVEAVIPAGYMKEMATLQPLPGESWSYGYDVTFMEYSGSLPKSTSTTPDTSNTINSVPSISSKTSTPPQTGLSDAAIIVYTQAGCGRCSFVKKEMKSKEIAFEEVDVNSGSPEANDMWVQLRNSGFTGTSVTMPVVRVNGKYHYNIKDLPGFVGKLEQ